MKYKAYLYLSCVHGSYILFYRLFLLCSPQVDSSSHSDQMSIHTVVGDDGKSYSISSLVSELTGHLRRPRIHSRSHRFFERKSYTSLGLNPLGLNDIPSEDINIQRKEYIYFPALDQGLKRLLCGKILCFVKHMIVKGVSRSQQLFKASSIDDDVWVKAFLIGENGSLIEMNSRYQKISVKHVNSHDNHADVRHGRIYSFDRTEFANLKTKLWVPLEKEAAEKRLAQEALKAQRLEECTYPLSQMKIAEVWAECQKRLGIEDKKELFAAIKEIETQLCVDLGLKEMTGSVTLSHLKIVLKALRRQNIMQDTDSFQHEDGDCSQ